MTKEIEIKDQAQVAKIVREANSADYGVWVATDTVMLDARSLLSLYTLIGKRVNVVTEDSVSPRSLDRLVAKMA